MTLDAGATTLMCKQDSDCQPGGTGANGRCVPMPRFPGCQCSFDQCFADADCPTNGVCECRTVAAGGGAARPAPTSPNVCKVGKCRVDQDCGGATGTGYCSPSLGPCGNYGGVVGYFCHTTKDKCTDDADCKAHGGGDCRFNATVGAWACETSQCAG
jgi:hypothetical protein